MFTIGEIACIFGMKESTIRYWLLRYLQIIIGEMKNMFSIGDIACIFGMKENSVRYWLKKNEKDYECDFYEFNINSLLHKISTKHRIKNKFTRHYTKYIVLDIEEFRYEFFKYVDFIKSIRQKKRAGKHCWTLSAIECYNCQMDCQKCSNKNICELIVEDENDEPPMKAIVRKLLEEIGKPPNPNFIE